MRYFIKLAYNGAPFFGWQIQPHHTSVQEVLEKAFSLLLKEKIEITGCGRTDTGVHAREYYAHFDLFKELPTEERMSLTNRLNSFLPREIAIEAIIPVPEHAHARFDAIERTYRYYVDISKDPFRFLYAYRVFEKLNINEMNRAAGILLSTDDFTSFSKIHTQVNNYRCKVTTACWHFKDGQLVFEITANRFLRNMVRAIVGTLLLVGKGKLSIDQFQDIINRKDRCSAGMSVPAHALFLEKIRYPEDYNL